MAATTAFAAVRGRDRDRMIGMATFATARPAQLEPAFDDLAGILATAVVAIDGRPALRVEFDPGSVSYEQLLERFWDADDAVTRSARRASAVLVHSAEQEAVARAARARRSLVLGRPVAAAVLRAGRAVGTPPAALSPGQASSSPRRSASQPACQARSDS